MRKAILIFTFLPFMISCQEKFNGENEQSFKKSRDLIEKNLNQSEKINLEKALRVIILEAMRVKWEKPKDYKGKSFNAISLEMVDGLSYSSLVDLSEDILKDQNKKEIEMLSKEIDSLNFQKKEFLNIQKSLNLFKISSLKINKIDFFGEQVPELEINYEYVEKTKIYGAKSIQFEIFKKSTNEIIKSEIMTYDDNSSFLEKGEYITGTLILRETNPKLQNAQKFPIENPNLADYDLKLKVTVLSLVLNGKKVELPKVNISQLDIEINDKKKMIDELKTVKGTLDELELTEN